MAERLGKILFFLKSGTGPHAYVKSGTGPHAHLKSGTGPHPHPATHGSVRSWVAGWGRGPVPDFFLS